MSRIHINVSDPYDVVVENRAIGRIGELIRPVCRTNRLAIVTDDIVERLYGDRAAQALGSAGFETVRFAFPNGEGSKNLGTLSAILEFLAANHIRRNDTLIALGGGVVGDTAGLAAALYMRGIDVIQIPTTLLSMVDSSVGGKTAVDLAGGKNMAGAFWQPSLVVCDPDIAADLPDGLFAEGMGEVIKCNVIGEMPVIGYIREGTLRAHLREVIEACIGLKRDVVEQDEFDQKGIRNILNAGHTIAHAVEKLSGYSVPHGAAVGMGLVAEARIAARMGICDKETVESIAEATRAFGLDREIHWSSAEMIDAMRSDKKNRDSRIVFELPRRLGLCEEFRLTADELPALLGD